jgi:hypothetical protein
MVNIAESPIVGGAESHLSGSNLRKQAHTFGHGCLEWSAMRRMRKAVCRKCLTKSEEMGAEWPFETDIMAAERPAMVHVAVDSCEGERENAPY